MVSRDHKLSVRRQCSLRSLTRSNLYYEPKGESAENLRFMEIIDKQFLETPWYGSRQMARKMKRNNHKCGRHRVRRPMRLMRLVPIYQEPNTRKKHLQHKIWPYLLKDVVIDRPNQVWCADITYIPMRRGFLYLVVQPQGVCLAAVKQHGYRLLRGSVERGVGKIWYARDIQHRSGQPVHQWCLDRRVDRGKGQDQYGRKRPLDRQPDD